MKKRKTADSGNQSDDWNVRLEQFLASPLAEKAAAGLSDRISVALHIDDKDFFFGRNEGANTLSRVEEMKPDIHFWLQENTLRHLLTLAEIPDTGIATFGVAIFERVFAKEESRKIKFRVDAGFLALWSKGYFSVLKAGGPEVASYLARFGYSGLDAIKAVLQKIRK